MNNEVLMPIYSRSVKDSSTQFSGTSQPSWESKEPGQFCLQHEMLGKNAELTELRQISARCCADKDSCYKQMLKKQNKNRNNFKETTGTSKQFI